MNTFLLMLSLVASESDARARVALALSNPPTVAVVENCPCGDGCDCGEGKHCSCLPTYSNEMLEKALKLNKPLVVCVNMKQKVEIEGSIMCRAKEYRGDSKTRLIHIFPVNGRMLERAPMEISNYPPLLKASAMSMGACAGGG